MEDVADSLNDAVLNDFRSAEQCERWPSKHCGWAHLGVRLFTRPLSASLRPRFRTNKPYFPTTIYLVVVHSQYVPGCLLPMHGPTNGDAAWRQQFFQQFFRVQFTFHFDMLEIIPHIWPICAIHHFTSHLLIIFDLGCKSYWVFEIENQTESNRIWKIRTDPSLV